MRKLKICKKKKAILEYLKNLCGAFSIVIFFLNSRRFIIFREKDGFIPIFYQKKNSQEIFISDSLKLLRDDNKLRINRFFLKKYIYYRYNYIYGNSETFYEGVNYVPAAAVVTISGNKVNTSIHTKLRFKIFNSISYEMAKKKIYNYSLELFDKRKKNYDNKTILALSGGLDSTTAAFFLSKINKKIASFTSNYNSNLLIDESVKAKKVSKLYSKKWLKININANDFLKSWKNIYKFYSTPLPTSSSLGYHIVYEKIKKKGFNKIINVGSPDHYFLGNYPAFLYYLSDLYRDKNKIFKSEIATWIKFHSTKKFPKTLKTFKNFYLSNILNDKSYTIQPKAELMTTKYVNDLNLMKPHKFTNSSYVNAYLNFSLWHSERAPGLVTFEELSHATGIETIDPFIGEKIKNFCYSLPTSYKIKNSTGKFILRDLMKEYLPKDIINFKGKIGFDVPFEQWAYKNVGMNKFILDIFISNEKNLFVKDLNMNEIIKDFKKNKINSMFLWQITNAILWAKSLH